ncbi:hypothetical protein RCC89_19865 [Cytophagaceae bacterium ABcell3]|nr:hypothetical protein RCC89_19865 [Cytophagaceae bacterium ABcell3]
MEFTKENIALIRDIIAIIGFPLIVYRLWILKSTFEQDHENKRNSKAVDLIKDWTKSLNSKSSTARKLVETFDQQQCIKLNKQETFEIEDSESNKKYFKVIFESEPTAANSKISIDYENSSKLRWEIITYLNTLESILTAYRHNVADREILKEQFTYLVKPEENHYVLAEFRKASGDKNYPAILDFAEELKNDMNKNNNGKPKTGRLWGWKKK